jgi:transposase
MAGHQRDPKRERFWRKVLARRARSGLNVSEFCSREGLVATTLAARDCSPRCPVTCCLFEKTASVTGFGVRPGEAGRFRNRNYVSSGSVTSQRHHSRSGGQHRSGHTLHIARSAARIMLSLALPVEIYLCTQPTDLRRGFDRLVQAALEHAGREVTCGGLCMFINSRRDRVKLLYWDGDGLCQWYKRLEAGRFQLPAVSPESSSMALSGTQLALILGGVDLRSVRQRKRYRQLA